jgi:YHS domain-containing protein
MFAFLARLFLFMVAISVIRSVVGMVQRAIHGVRPTAPARQTTGATMLQQDPVCGTYVAIDSSLKRIVNGRVIHFCSPDCRDKYVA